MQKTVPVFSFSTSLLCSQSKNILRKLATMESDLSTIVPATLMKSFSVMGNFLETFQVFNKNSFQFKEQVISDVVTSVTGEWLLRSNNCNKS